MRLKKSSSGMVGAETASSPGKLDLNNNIYILGILDLTFRCIFF